MDLQAAYQYCLQFTRRHYENFPVASYMIPTHYRKHIAAIYTFARQADDFSDELKDRNELLKWQKYLYDCLEEKSDNPTFYALANTIKKFNLPVQWFDDLITAFLWDLDKNRFNSYAELRTYSRYSANPVGRIILWIFNFRSEQLFQYSDYITTALQLTNFWQDISIDLEKDRIYIPLNVLERFQLNEQDIIKRQNSQHFTNLIIELVQYTKLLYNRGLPLLKYINGRLQWELKLTVMGGLTILAKVERSKNCILISRPSLSKYDWIKITGNLIFNQ